MFAYKTYKFFDTFCQVGFLLSEVVLVMSINASTRAPPVNRVHSSPITRLAAGVRSSVQHAVV